MLSDSIRKQIEENNKKGATKVLRYCEKTLLELPIDLSPDRVYLKLQRLAALIKLKKFDIPASDFEDVIELIEKTKLQERIAKLWKGIIFNLWGISLGTRGFFNHAVDKYRSSLELDPQGAAMLNNIGLNLMYLGKWNSAAQVLEDGLNNTSQEDYGLRGSLLTNLGELLRRWEKSEAEQILKEALDCNEKAKENEGFAEAAYSLLRLYVEKKELEKAEIVIERLKKLRSSPNEHYYRLFRLRAEGLWALVSKDPEQSISDYKAALELAIWIQAHEHVLGIQSDLALVFLHQAIQGQKNAIARLETLFSQIIGFSENTGLNFILIETLLLKTKFFLWKQEYVLAYELLARVLLLLDQFPYTHLKERFFTLENALETIKMKSTETQDIQMMDLEEFISYIKECSKMCMS